MTSWPNIRKGMRTPPRYHRAPKYGAVDWAKAAGAKGPYPCPTPGCGLVYTPGYRAEHIRDYHGDMLGKIR